MSGGSCHADTRSQGWVGVFLGRWGSGEWDWVKGGGGEWAEGGEEEALGWHTREAVSGRGGGVGVFVAAVNGSGMSMLG